MGLVRAWEFFIFKTLSKKAFKVTDNQGVKETGEVMKDGLTQSIKDVKKIISYK